MKAAFISARNFGHLWVRQSLPPLPEQIRINALFVLNNLLPPILTTLLRPNMKQAVVGVALLAVPISKSVVSCILGKGSLTIHLGKLLSVWENLVNERPPEVFTDVFVAEIVKNVNGLLAILVMLEHVRGQELDLLPVLQGRQVSCVIVVLKVALWQLVIIVNVRQVFQLHGMGSQDILHGQSPGDILGYLNALRKLILGEEVVRLLVGFLALVFFDALHHGTPPSLLILITTLVRVMLAVISSIQVHCDCYIFPLKLCSPSAPPCSLLLYHLKITLQHFVLPLLPRRSLLAILH
mmetsp:Transcript_6280/g.11507  ORF Transcript_6280/g.11507 Transcript_6280/m.11507 type:complete len:295 (+) Transcript_6280:1148-2032(+)